MLLLQLPVFPVQTNTYRVLALNVSVIQRETRVLLRKMQSGYKGAAPKISSAINEASNHALKFRNHAFRNSRGGVNTWTGWPAVKEPTRKQLLWVDEALIRRVKRTSRGRVCSWIALKGPTVAMAVQKVNRERAALGFQVSTPPRPLHSGPCGCLNFVDMLQYLRQPSERTSCIIYVQSAMRGRSTRRGTILRVRGTHLPAALL